MRNHCKITYTIIFLLNYCFLFSQNKAVNPNTYSKICFYTLDKSKIQQFTDIAQKIEQEEYREILRITAEMKKDLKDFRKKKINRGFEIWYEGNYTDFNNQVNISLESTLNSLIYYENRIRSRDVLYYENRHFLEIYLAYLTEIFYPEYWFMTQERYISKATFQRICDDNNEGNLLFSKSKFYKYSDFMNIITQKENRSTAEYLGKDTKLNFIRHSFWMLKKDSAEEILNNFKFNDASMELSTDREISELHKFIDHVVSDKIILLMRINS